MKHHIGVIQVNKFDCIGGAARIGWTLFKELEKRGISSYYLVGTKKSTDPRVFEMPNTNWVDKIETRILSPEKKICKNKVFQLSMKGLHIISHPHKSMNTIRGYENYHYPATWNLLNLIPSWKPDIIHSHNLHGGYFDLRALPALSNSVPFLITLHDAWLLGGHCAHSFSCSQWETGCNLCPDITIPPAIRKDSAYHNWNMKKEIYAGSQLYIASPCQWLMDKVKKSIIAKSIIQCKVIPNGINSHIFHPYHKTAARGELNLPVDSIIILFTAYGITHSFWKDYYTMRSAIKIISENKIRKKILFLALGEEAQSEKMGNTTVRFIQYQSDPRIVARYFQAADIYIHAAKADTFPTTILESLACGTPVVATSVGGIPEQIIDKKNGFLTSPGDPFDMAEKIQILIDNENLMGEMGYEGYKSIKTNFDLNIQMNTYVHWYTEILNK